MFVGLLQHTPGSQSQWWRTWPESEPRDPRRNEKPRKREKVSTYSSSLKHLGQQKQLVDINTFASLVHPELCPFIANLAECESSEPYKGYSMFIGLLAHTGESTSI